MRGAGPAGTINQQALRRRPRHRRATTTGATARSFPTHCPSHPAPPTPAALGAGRALLQCTVSSVAIAGSESENAVAEAVASAFADCRKLPEDQSCDAVAKSKAEVLLTSKRAQTEVPASSPLRCSPLPLPMQAVANATARALAATAGSVEGGPGCRGQAEATASAKATAYAEVGWEKTKGGCSGGSF